MTSPARVNPVCCLALAIASGVFLQHDTMIHHHDPEQQKTGKRQTHSASISIHTPKPERLLLAKQKRSILGSSFVALLFVLWAQ